VKANAHALATSLQAEGLGIVSGGTDNHLMLVDLRPFGAKGRHAEHALDRAAITCNKNSIPFDNEKPLLTSGIRLGTPAGTTRGLARPSSPRSASGSPKWLPRLARTAPRVMRRSRPPWKPSAGTVRRFPIYPNLAY
jgi:glycine hydroxymethyltransferase